MDYEPTNERVMRRIYLISTTGERVEVARVEEDGAEVDDFIEGAGQALKHGGSIRVKAAAISANRIAAIQVSPPHDPAQL